MNIWCDPDDGDARKILDAIRSRLPVDAVSIGSRNHEGMAAGEMLITAFSHVAVMGLIESVRLVWELYQTPVKVQMPNGTVVTVKGAPGELVNQLKLAAEQLRASNSTEELNREADQILSKLRSNSPA
jgi:hypothetical protein